MEIDTPPSPVVETRHRNHRERDITIRFEDSPSNGGKNRSIFAENDRTRPPYQRQETCRVFVEGEGEITRFDTPPYYQRKHQYLNSNHNNVEHTTTRGTREAFFLDAGDNRASIFQRNKTEKPAEAFLEEDGPGLRTLPYELTFADSSEEENEDEEESCLKEIFPSLHADELKHVRVVERLADIFIGCLSVRGSLRLGPTAFRMFARFVKI